MHYNKVFHATQDFFFYIVLEFNSLIKVFSSSSDTALHIMKKTLHVMNEIAGDYCSLCVFGG